MRLGLELGLGLRDRVIRMYRFRVGVRVRVTVSNDYSSDYANSHSNINPNCKRIAPL
jgi:hypothetical protein